jgi:RNA polymerase sigma-70 factor (ECF subfamily)
MEQTMIYPEDNSHLQQASVESVVELARSGNRAASTEIVRRYRNTIRRTTLSILKNMDDAEDATQEVCLRVFTKIHTFEGSAKFSTWLTRIAINVSLMRLRQQRNDTVMSLSEFAGDDDSSWFLLKATSPDPERQCAANDLSRRLRTAVSKLPSHLRSVAHDHYFEELPVREMANKQGLSLSAVKSRLYRARKLLARSKLVLPLAAPAYTGFELES